MFKIKVISQREKKITNCKPICNHVGDCSPGFGYSRIIRCRQELRLKQKDRMLGWPCCPSGQLHTKASIGRAAYCPGQDVKISGLVNNESSKTVVGFEAQLVQTVQCYRKHLKVTINPLTTRNDKDLISPHSIAAKSIIKATGIKEIIATKGALDCSTNSLCRYDRE